MCVCAGDRAAVLYGDAEVAKEGDAWAEVVAAAADEAAAAEGHPDVEVDPDGAGCGDGYEDRSAGCHILHRVFCLQAQGHASGHIVGQYCGSFGNQ